MLSHALNGEGDKTVAGSESDPEQEACHTGSILKTGFSQDLVSKIVGKGKGAPRVPQRAPGQPHWNVGRSFAKPWKGTWGPHTDPRSRLSRLIKRIVQEELIPLYGEPQGQAVTSLMTEVATWKGIARSTLAQLGQGKEFTTRKAASASRIGAAKEAELAKIAGLRKPWQPTSGEELWAVAQAEKAKKNTPPRRTR